MKKSIAGGIVALLVAGGVAFTGGAASAHTPEASATCEAITISATSYDGTRPAQGEPTVTIANPDYKPATPGSPAVGTPTITVPNPSYVPEQPAVYEDQVTEREYKKWKIWWWDVQWFPATATPGGWEPTGNVRTESVKIKDAVPAQGTPTIEVANPDYRPAVDPTPEQGTPTITVANPDYVPADTTPNTVTASVDGAQVYAAEFGSSHRATIPINGATKHDWSVTITAWNDPSGSKGWTKTITGKTAACPPVGITVPDLTVNPPTCDADGTLPFLGNPAAQNPNGYEFPGQGFRVYLDRAYAGPGTYTATLQKVGAGFDPAYPYGTKITGGSTTQTLTVAARTGYQDGDAEKPCYVEVPDETVITGEWATGEYECGDTEVTETRTVETTTYTLNRVTGGISSSTTSTTEERTRDLTDEEIDALDCAVVTPPTEEPTDETPVAEQPKPVAAAARTAQAEDTLATTGGETAWGAAALAFGMIAAGTIAMAVRRRRAA